METQKDNASNFHLAQTDTAFNSRSNDVFSCLDTIEAKHKDFEQNRSDNRFDFLKPDPTEEPVTCKSNFKIPRGRPKKHKVPDYKVRPEKWKMYSLSDVSTDLLSENSNQRAALAFIDSVRMRNAISSSSGSEEVDQDEMEVDVARTSFASDKQHVFRKPTKCKQPLKTDLETESPQKPDGQSNLKSVLEPPLEEFETEENAKVSVKEVDSSEVHFQGKSFKNKHQNIRPKTLVEDDEEQDLEAQNTEKRVNLESDDDSSDFSEDDTTRNSEDEESRFTELENIGDEWFMINARELRETKSEEQDHSDEDDVYKRAAELAFVQSIHSNTSFVVVQENGREKGDEVVDDLDNVD